MFGPSTHGHFPLQFIPLWVGSASFFLVSVKVPYIVLAQVGGELSLPTIYSVAAIVFLSSSTKLREVGQLLIQELTDEEVNIREMR